MNQSKIGKFIAEKRKEQKLTQQDLAEKIGVSDRTIGNWENGRNLPDVSLFKPLCDILSITINDLISGEKIDSKNYEDKFEENIINTLNFTNKKIKENDDKIGILLIILGICFSILSLSFYPSNSPVNIIGSIVGVLITSVGLNKLVNKLNWFKRILIFIIFLIAYGCVLFTLDITGVVDMDFSFYIWYVF